MTQGKSKAAMGIQQCMEADSEARNTFGSGSWRRSSPVASRNRFEAEIASYRP